VCRCHVPFTNGRWRVRTNGMKLRAVANINCILCKCVYIYLYLHMYKVCASLLIFFTYLCVCKLCHYI
jgi:hypothetical protein